MTGDLKAINWSVLVVEDQRSTKTQSGFVIPMLSRLPPSTGFVYGVSERARKDHPEIRPGCRLHYKPFGGREFVWKGVHMRMLHKEDTLALLENG